MNSVIDFAAKVTIWFLQFKYHVVAFKASWKAVGCLYDQETSEQRMCEAVGLAMTEDAIRDMFKNVLSERVSRYNTLLYWWTIGIGACALQDAGWSNERYNRMVKRIIERIGAETTNGVE